MSYEIVNSVMMYLTNAYIFDFARDVFQWDMLSEPTHSENHEQEKWGFMQNYVREKWDLRLSGRLWGALDIDNRQRLIDAALRKYGVEACVRARRHE